MKSTWKLAALGLAGAAGVGAWLYSRRPLGRTPSLQSIDDPAVARAYGWVARLPQMRLIRALVAARAIELAPLGYAVDLGCGPGYLVLDLARAAPSLCVTGVDVSAEMLAQGEDNARRAGLAGRVAFRCGDAQQIPFPDSSLDLVVSTLSLHHWTDPVAAFDEIARVLRPGGAFVVFDLRRDMAAPAWLLLWFATHVVVPPALRRIGEPLGSRNAAYTVQEVMGLTDQSTLRGAYVTAGPLWLTVEGTV